MDLLQITCQLNNDGVALLLSGNLKGALQTLQSALSFMKQLANAEDVHDVSPHQQMQVRVPFKESPKDICDSANQYCFVYNRPLFLETVANRAELETLLPIYSSVVIFNLAMAYHQSACYERKSMKRASMLYKMCAQLLQTSTLQSLATTTLLLLALNNRAQIHYDECDYVQSRNCFDMLSQILSKNQDVTMILSETVVQGMILNTMLLEPPMAAQAA
jgi:hypothetical protein